MVLLLNVGLVLSSLIEFEVWLVVLQLPALSQTLMEELVQVEAALSVEIRQVGLLPLAIPDSPSVKVKVEVWLELYQVVLKEVFELKLGATVSTIIPFVQPVQLLEFPALSVQ